MRVTARRGVTLVEVLVALVIAGIIGAAATRLLLLQSRLARRFAAVDGARQTVAATSAWLESELLEAAPRDLLAVAPDSLVYRSWRSAGLACLVTPTEVRIPGDGRALWRLPQPGRDSLAIYYQPDSAAPRSWVTLPIHAVGTGTCGASAALRIQTSVAGRVPNPPPVLVPVRIFEVMTAKLYRSLGDWWLGARSVSGGEGLQPVTGPFERDGVRFQFDPPSVIELQLTPLGAAATGQILDLRNLP